MSKKKKELTIEEMLKDSPLKSNDELIQEYTDRLNEAINYKSSTNETMLDLISMALLPDEYRNEDMDKLDEERIKLTVARMTMTNEINECLSEIKKLQE